MFSKSKNLTQYIEKEVDRLEKELEKVSQTIHEYDERIHKHNVEMDRLCKERVPFTEEYHKLYKQKELAKKTLEYAQAFEKE